jgi:hypothetical protein
LACSGQDSSQTRRHTPRGGPYNVIISEFAEAVLLREIERYASCQQISCVSTQSDDEDGSYAMQSRNKTASKQARGKFRLRTHFPFSIYGQRKCEGHASRSMNDRREVQRRRLLGDLMANEIPMRESFVGKLGNDEVCSRASQSDTSMIHPQRRSRDPQIFWYL